MVSVRLCGRSDGKFRNGTRGILAGKRTKFRPWGMDAERGVGGTEKQNAPAKPRPEEFPGTGREKILPRGNRCREGRMRSEK